MVFGQDWDLEDRESIMTRKLVMTEEPEEEGETRPNLICTETGCRDSGEQRPSLLPHKVRVLSNCSNIGPRNQYLICCAGVRLMAMNSLSSFPKNT